MIRLLCCRMRAPIGMHQALRAWAAARRLNQLAGICRYSRLALFPSSVRRDRLMADSHSWPRWRDLSSAPVPGITRLVIPMRRAVVPGSIPCIATASLAGTLRINSAWPRRMALTIDRAALRALIDVSGLVAKRLNHVYSALLSPLKNAFTCDPVLISPGMTVVT